MNTLSANDFISMLPFLIPILIIQLVLMIIAIRKIIKQKQFRYLNKYAWLIIVILFQFLGPISYFILEREG